MELLKCLCLLWEDNNRGNKTYYLHLFVIVLLILMKITWIHFKESMEPSLATTHCTAEIYTYYS